MFFIKILVYLYSLFIIVFSSSVIAYKHPIYSLLCLVSSFILASILLLLLESELLALLLILIYGGAVAILFLFTIMMLESKLNNLLKNVTQYIPVVFFFSLLLIVPLAFKILSVYDLNDYILSVYYNNYKYYYNLIEAIPDINSYSYILYSYTAIPLLFVGLILLLVLVGITYFTNSIYNDSQRTGEQLTFKQLTRCSTLSVYKLLRQR